MKIKIIGKELKITEAINDYVEKKLDRIGKYFEDAEADVTLKTEKDASEMASRAEPSYRRPAASSKQRVTSNRWGSTDGYFFDLKTMIATINVLKAINSDNTSYVLMCFSAVRYFHRHHLQGAGASQPCGFT